MKPRNLLILLLVVLALGAFLWFVERDLPGSEEREERAARVLPGLETGDVTALTLEVGEGERVRLERQGGQGQDGAVQNGAEGGEAGGTATTWRFADPERYAGTRADATAVDDLLSALAGLTRERTVEGVEPAAVGLDAPRARVVLELEGAEALTLLVGGEVPASNNMIVGQEVAGGEVAEDAYVVNRGIYADLDRAAGDWRARDLFPGERGDVERIVLSAAGREAPVVLARRGGGTGSGFDLVEPLADRADPGAVDALLAALTGLTAERFLDDVTADDLAELGLAPPRGTVRVETEGVGEPFVAEVGAPTATDSLHLRLGGAQERGQGRGQVVTARTALLEAVERPADEWPSRSLTERRIFEIVRVEVEEPGATLTLERATPDWRRDGERIPYTPVSDLLYALTDARAERTLPLETLRLAGPELTFTLTAEAGAGDGESGEEPAPAVARETLALHPAGDDGTVPATVSGRDRVLLLSAAAVAPIRDALAAVRTAEPLPEDPGEAGGGGGGLPDGVEVEVEEGP